MHMLVLLVVALLLFGKRLPEVGRSLGRGISEFKKGLRDVSDEMNKDDADAPKLHPPKDEAKATRENHP
jgi:sec-independent protein translocase protein TatA